MADDYSFGTVIPAAPVDEPAQRLGWLETIIEVERPLLVPQKNLR
jgi:hypothetical protein